MRISRVALSSFMVGILGISLSIAGPTAAQAASKKASSTFKVTSYSQAKAAGTAGSINWGSKCDTSLGTLAFPSVYAPQCYAPLTGSNGGATSSGVTGSTIKVVLYLPPQDSAILHYIFSPIPSSDFSTNAQVNATMQQWMKFFNTYYNLYGRQVQLVTFTGTGDINNAVAAEADATTIAAMHPFAVWGGPSLTPAFADTLAAHKVVCIGCGGISNSAYYQKNSPYEWTLSMLPEQNLIEMINWMKNQVNGHNAIYAGQANFKTQKRVFGVIALSSTTTADATNQALVKSFNKNGIKIAQLVTYQSPIDLQTSAPSLIAKLKAAGVTSIIYAGDPIGPQTLTKAATSANYFPEWLLSGTSFYDVSIYARTYDQKQWAHAFGVTTNTVPTATNQWVSLYKWYFGQAPESADAAILEIGDATMFFAALQTAGPKLTPTNFKNGLFAAPVTKANPIKVSSAYGNHGIWPTTDYAGTDDNTLTWWNPTVVGPDSYGHVGAGLYEYSNGGTRYLPSQWPTQVFKKNLKNSVTSYQTLPPGVTVPTYPSPAG